MIRGGEETESENLVVSWESLERRKAELDESSDQEDSREREGDFRLRAAMEICARISNSRPPRKCSAYSAAVGRKWSATSRSLAAPTFPAWTPRKSALAPL